MVLENDEKLGVDMARWVDLVQHKGSQIFEIGGIVKRKKKKHGIVMWSVWRMGEAL